MSNLFLNRLASRRQLLRRSGQAAIAALFARSVASVKAATAVALLESQGAQSLHAVSLPPMITPIRPTLQVPDVSLDVKIGQMLMLGFQGTRLDENNIIVKAIRDQHVGNVVLFDQDSRRSSKPRNIESPEQLKALTGSLQALVTSGIPLIISIDQEGGLVNRLKERYGFPPTLSHAALGELNNPEETRAYAAAMAQTLADMGINLNLAPVVDVAVNPFNPIIARVQRSFSSDPEVVAAQANAFVDGHHDKGIKCTLKHFPGHGSSQGDTHQGFVNVTRTWSEGELIPYRRLIEQGKVDAVMTAHIFDANLDAELPATLSPAIIDGLLRQQLGYDGVVISDDMQMRAITDLFRLDKAFELAIVAGIDIIAVANNLTYSGTIPDRFITTVHRLLEKGVITEERINQSFQRIMRLKGLV